MIKSDKTVLDQDLYSDPTTLLYIYIIYRLKLAGNFTKLSKSFFHQKLIISHLYVRSSFSSENNLDELSLTRTNHPYRVCKLENINS